MDYLVERIPDGSFTVKGDWPKEVMVKQQDRSNKGYHLYKPGDKFIVDENGILRKQAS